MPPSRTASPSAADAHTGPAENHHASGITMDNRINSSDASGASDRRQHARDVLTEASMLLQETQPSERSSNRSHRHPNGSRLGQSSNKIAAQMKNLKRTTTCTPTSQWDEKSTGHTNNNSNNNKLPSDKVSYVRMTPIQMRKLLATAQKTNNGGGGTRTSPHAPAAPKAEESLMQRITQLRDILTEKNLDALPADRQGDANTHSCPNSQTLTTGLSTDNNNSKGNSCTESSQEVAAMYDLYRELGSFLSTQDQHPCATGTPLLTTTEEIAAITGVQPSSFSPVAGANTNVNTHHNNGANHNREDKETFSLPAVIRSNNNNNNGGTANHSNTHNSLSMSSLLSSSRGSFGKARTAAPYVPHVGPGRKMSRHKEEKGDGEGEGEGEGGVGRNARRRSVLLPAMAVPNPPQVPARRHSNINSNSTSINATFLPLPLTTTSRASERRSSTINGDVEENPDESGSDEGSLAAEVNEARFDRALEEVNSIMADNEMVYSRVQKFANDMTTLMKSWLHISSNENFDKCATDVFAVMIENHPEYRDLFFSADLREQSKTVFDMIGKAVVAFVKMDNMLDLLSEMGARHCLYNVSYKHYTAIRDAFFKVYPSYVTQAMYDESIEIWYMFWKVTIELLVSGARTQRAKYFLRRKHELWIDRLQQGFQTLEARQRAPPGDARTHLFIPFMYDAAVSLEPRMAQYAALRDVRPSDRSFRGIGRIIRHLRQDKKVRRYCTELAIRHQGYNLTAEMLIAAGPAFMAAVDHFMRDEPTYNPPMATDFRDFWKYMVELWSPDLVVAAHTELENNNAPDRSSPFCILFTDIEASTNLWEANPDAMRKAVHEHHHILRGLISDYGGYEVKTVGDSFMVATKDAHIALQIALGIQLELMRRPIAPGFSMAAAVSNPQGSGDPSCWRDDGLRVRIGIHYCEEASAVYDNVHRRFDYYGPSVNCAARVEAAACGGQILMTREAVEALKHTDFYTKPHSRYLADYTTCNRDPKLPLSELTKFEDIGGVMMKGIAYPIHLFSVLPIALAGRTFQPIAGQKTKGSGDNAE